MNTHLDPIFLGEVYTTYRQCLELMGINCTLGCDAPEELQHIKSGELFFAEENLKYLIDFIYLFIYLYALNSYIRK